MVLSSDDARLGSALRFCSISIPIGWLLMIAPSAVAGAGPTSSASSQRSVVAAASFTAPNAISATPASTGSAVIKAPDFASLVAVRLAPLMPDGVRVRGVTLGCDPPADATLESVAPGLTRLQSRGFVTEFRSKDRTLVCGASVTAERQVMVAVHDIAPSEPITEHDFEPKWVDAFADAIGALGKFPDQGPYVGATLIRAGQPLYPDDLARPLAVHAGDLVMVLVKNGLVTVRARLEARSSAAVGEKATMVNPTNGVPLTVTVTGPGMAELVMQ